MNWDFRELPEERIKEITSYLSAHLGTGAATQERWIPGDIEPDMASYIRGKFAEHENRNYMMFVAAFSYNSGWMGLYERDSRIQDLLEFCAGGSGDLSEKEGFFGNLNKESLLELASLRTDFEDPLYMKLADINEKACGLFSKAVNRQPAPAEEVEVRNKALGTRWIATVRSDPKLLGSPDEGLGSLEGSGQEDASAIKSATIELLRDLLGRGRNPQLGTMGQVANIAIRLYQLNGEGQVADIIDGVVDPFSMDDASPFLYALAFNGIAYDAGGVAPWVASFGKSQEQIADMLLGWKDPAASYAVLRDAAYYAIMPGVMYRFAESEEGREFLFYLIGTDASGFAPHLVFNTHMQRESPEDIAELLLSLRIEVLDVAIQLFDNEGNPAVGEAVKAILESNDSGSSLDEVD